jgi:hypothetical protein
MEELLHKLPMSLGKPHRAERMSRFPISGATLFKALSIDVSA